MTARRFNWPLWVGFVLTIAAFLTTIKDRIQKAQIRAALSVNREQRKRPVNTSFQSNVRAA